MYMAWLAVADIGYLLMTWVNAYWVYQCDCGIPDEGSALIDIFTFKDTFKGNQCLKLHIIWRNNRYNIVATLLIINSLFSFNVGASDMILTYMAYNRLRSISQIEQSGHNLGILKRLRSKRGKLAGKYLVVAQIVSAFIVSFVLHLPHFIDDSEYGACNYYANADNANDTHCKNFKL